ncbi:thioredoxin family protein [Prevotella sp.]|uniref:thioredoxin family protein n=1 Tax=Prevotella sp. TaxID=59823 RepID=UPI003DA23338
MKIILKKVLVAILSLLSLHSVAQTTEGVKFEAKSLTELMEQAQKEHKMVFIDCFTTWCGPCRKMAQEVFPQKVVGDFFRSHFVSAQMDMEKGKAIELGKKWDINSYPTYIILDADGNQKLRLVGYFQPQKLVDTLSVMLKHAGPSAVELQYSAGDHSSIVVSKYIAQLEKLSEKAKIKQVSEDFCNHNPQVLLNDTTAFRIFQEYIRDPYAPSFVYVYDHRQEFIEKYGDNIADELEFVWKTYAKTYYIFDPVTMNFHGYDIQKMDEYEAYMKHNGVKNASVYVMSYKLPSSFIMKDKKLLMKNLQEAATMKGISQTQFDYGCKTLEGLITDKKDKKLLEKIKKTNSTIK